MSLLWIANGDSPFNNKMAFRMYTILRHRARYSSTSLCRSHVGSTRVQYCKTFSVPRNPVFSRRRFLINSVVKKIFADKSTWKPVFEFFPFFFFTRKNKKIKFSNYFSVRWLYGGPWYLACTKCSDSTAGVRMIKKKTSTRTSRRGKETTIVIGNFDFNAR